IVEGVHPLLDAEAVRMISTMPKWKAGKQRGVKVRVKYTLPVVFRLVSKDKDSTVVPDESSDDLFVVVEKQPEFPGGMQALMEFIGDSIRYPKESIENGIQGRVITNFIIHKDGSISDINITEGIDPLLDAEAIRMISTMPKWKPGMQRGKAVNVRYTLPVVYRLQK
ncbi:MAG: energy transducer TonB, partial [Dysgonamonadaceae bacterium]